MKNKVKLSIIVMVGNEESLIQSCLESCKFADENIFFITH